MTTLKLRTRIHKKDTVSRVKGKSQSENRYLPHIPTKGLVSRINTELLQSCRKKAKRHKKALWERGNPMVNGCWKRRSKPLSITDAN